jgi:hypothetical protein
LAAARRARDHFAVRPLLVLALLAGPVYAERYVVQRGETLEHVATAKGCSVEVIERANNLKTTLVPAGTRIDIPDCSLRSRARGRTRKVVDDDAVEGATFQALGAGEGYELRRPQRAFGARHVIEHLRSTIAVVRALYPDVHTLAVGDISAVGGGKLDNHKSHRTGLDVDVGFYFKKVPAGYPDKFVGANADLDLEATWALVVAFARTQQVDDGVSIIFCDYAVQKRLYDWAHARGTPDEDLAELLQYPRGKDSMSGLVRHWPNHSDHLHVRFKAK